MSYLDKLLEGVEVEWKMLGEIGTFYGGLTGKNKSDFSDGNAKFITYMNVFTNMAVNVDINTLVRIGKNESQNKVEYGDVLFTGSSETPNECGMSSVMTTKTEEIFYLNSFCFGFRLTDKTLFSPDFLKFLFRDEKIRKQISKTASGVTRFNVSKARFSKITIPIPPLEIQNEIVRILDKFSTLTAELQAELQAELTARKKQYNYYRDQLLSFEAGEVEWKPLGEVLGINRGRRLIKSQLKETGEYAVFQNCMIPLGYYHESNVNANTTFIISAGSAGEIGYSSVNFWAADDVYYFTTPENFNSKFLYYFLLTQQQKITGQVRRSSVPRLSKTAFEKMPTPIPSLEEQERIVAILDKFDTLTTSISEGLPKEIELRQKQYEYYRNMLLSFNELPNE